MSYGFNMLFAEAENIGDAFCIANAFVKRHCTKEKMEKSILDNEFFIPSLRNGVTPCTAALSKTADKFWLYSLFTFRFVYWEKQHLLGLLREDTDDWAESNQMQGKSSVYFQNSCDKDYEFEEWPTFIPFFNTAVAEYKKMLKMPKGKVFSIIKSQGGYTPDEDNEEDEISDVAYYIRTALYDHIFNVLDLNAWMYGRESEAFERFSINALDTSELALDMSMFVNRRVNTLLGGIYEKRSMLVPVVIEGSANTFLFHYIYKDGDTQNVRDLVRKAISEYMNTEDGKRLAKKHNGVKYVTYDEALFSIPTSWFSKYGLILMKDSEYRNTAVMFGYDECIHMEDEDS